MTYTIAVPQYKRTLISEDGTIHVGSGRVMFAVLIGGANAVGLGLYDSATTTENKIGALASPKEDFRVLDLGPVGGVPFQNGLYLDISGVGASAAIWIDA